MNKKFEFRDQNGEYYALKINKNKIQLEAYLLSENQTGLSNTECYHELKDKDIPAFLNGMGLKNVEELMSLLQNFNTDNWSKLHQKLAEDKSESFIWQETNWNV